MPTVPSGEGWFTWNDVDCRDYGIYVLTQPTFIRPAERLSSVTIPGKSGSLTLREGPDVYEDISLSCMCVIDKPDENVILKHDANDNPYYVDSDVLTRLNDICSWLKGVGKVRFANRPNGYYYARIANQISFDRVLRDNPHKAFSVEFQCHPFRYLDIGDDPIYVKSSRDTYGVVPPVPTSNVDYVDLSNRGNVFAEPLIVAYSITQGSGLGRISVTDSNSSGVVLKAYSNTFVDFSKAPSSQYNYVRIDSEQKIAYVDASILGGYRLTGAMVSGDFPYFPMLSDDTFRVSIDPELLIAYIKIIPRWRCL